MSVFRLTMLPASEGDCLILSYGDDEAALRHIVIDGGRKATWPHLKAALAAIAARGESVELLVLSHIDADHIDGLVELVQAPDLPLVPKAVWYNGFDQLKALEAEIKLTSFGIKAADLYSKALAQKGWPLNEVTGGKAIRVEELPDAFNVAGLTLTLLSPDTAKLLQLLKNWRKALAPAVRVAAPAGGGLQAFGQRPMPAMLDPEHLSAPSNIDTTVPNGSSIAMIAEFDGRRVLLGADAHPDLVLKSLERVAEKTGEKVAIDLVKLPHHGSRANITRAIIEKLDCDRYAISTSGAVFGHPDPEAISRILKFAPAQQKTLYFNYRSERTEPWDQADLKTRYDYRCVFPDADQPLVVDI